MRLVRHLSIFALAFSVLLPLKGQNPVSRIDPGDPDLELLREALQRSIDELRGEKELGDLEMDETLRSAARMQAAYIHDRERLTHFQNDAMTRTPRKRVRNVGGRHRPVGENLIKVFVERGMSYRALADTMATIWKRSPPHYANIKNEAFERSGIGFSYDKESRALYAAQVFGGPPPSFDVSELPEPSAYQRFISVLFPPCRPYRKRWDPGALTFSNGRMLIDDYRLGKRLLRDEHPLYVRYKNLSFDCGRGVVTEEQRTYRLKDRRAMIRDAKAFSDKGLPSIEIGGEERYLDLFRDPDKMQVRFELPREPFGKDSVYRTTLYFLKRKMTCKRVEMLDLRLRFDEGLPYPSIPFDTSSGTYPSPIVKEVHRDTFTTDTIHFHRNRTELPLDSLEGKLREWKERGGRIQGIDGVVTASMEGSEQKNQELLKARKQDLADRIDTIFPNDPSVNIRTQENGEGLRNDVAPRLPDSLSGLPDGELRELVNANLDDPRIDSLLYRQRYVRIRAFRKRVSFDTIDLKGHNEKMIDRFNTLLRRLDDSTKRRFELASMVDEMVSIQKDLQQGYLKGHVGEAELSELNTGRLLDRIRPPIVRLGWIRYREILFRYIVLEELRTPEFFKELQRLARYRVPGRRGKEKKYLINELDRQEVQRFVTSNALAALRISPYAASDPEAFMFCFPDGGNTARRSSCRGRKEESGDVEAALENIRAFADWRGVSGVSDDSLEKMEAYYHVQKLRLIFPQLEENEKEIREHTRALDRYYTQGDRLTKERRVRLAKFFYLFEQRDDALSILDPLLEGTDPYARAVGTALRIEREELQKQEAIVELFREYRANYAPSVLCDALRVYWREGGDLRTLKGGPVRDLVCSNCSLSFD